MYSNHYEIFLIFYAYTSWPSFLNCKEQCCAFVNISNNNSNNENTTKKEDRIAPSENPEERPNLQDYKSKEESSNRVNDSSSSSCKYCNKTYSNMEELTAHYRKEHPESL